MNLPNRLTVLRFILAAIFVIAVSIPFPYRYSVGLFLFLVASYTDYLDGEIARRQGLITNFGKLMDPVADKVLMTASFVVLCREGLLPAWVVIAILAREFFVTGIRLLAMQQGKVLAAEKLGKHKLFWQVLTSVFFLLTLAASEWPFQWAAPLLHDAAFSFWTGWILIAVTGALSIISGFSYLWKNRELFNDA